MPAYSFKCPVCHKLQRAILSVEEAKGDVPCRTTDCSGLLKRVPRAPSTQIVETLDNGLMARRLERPADAEQIYNERAHGKKGII